ncbi:sugar O-acetyltransferase [Lactobacillus sp. LC28-10]|uniref:Acetyltransferase n=1 Tax=Secundilactobacillus angelensis TaxID=2722706 RepID=A0ABX1KWD7_9LACO|nr:sugar O-acetyltransferase [Secundilactobacillus angelensis]MCH5461244.1 sugar O-acetyltransferase [Secundilactobacillus angelensis]NLR17560.1 sugar O-acetyltransferase [Secundilactobacillus angelensis]
MTEDMHNGNLYLPMDKAILKEQEAAQELLYDYNQTRPGDHDKRQQLLKQMFAEVGVDTYIEPTLHANFGGKHLHFGSHVYANYNLTAVDDTHIFVGDYTMFGPNVTLDSATHPILPELREKVYQYNLPIRVGRNCWLGAGVIVLPGVTIGDNSVIGAGSVVTRDIPANVVAVGTPCHVMRNINERDRHYYHQGREIDWSKIK